MTATLACVTIGQAPRTDVVPDIAAVLGPSVRIVEAGALDGLALSDVQALAPRPGLTPQATRMADGTGVAIAKELILDRLQGCVDRVVDAGATAILLLCTGKFPAFSSPVPIYQPGRLVRAAVDALVAPGQRLGVLCPLPEQVPNAAAKWGGEGREIVAAAASPYHGEEVFLAGARELARLEPDIVLLDCMGFRVAHKAAVRAIFPRTPVILANTAAARVLAEVL